MSADHWERLKPIFFHALDLPESERAAYLDTACADDPELRAEIEALLEADLDLPSLFAAAPDDLALLLNEEAGSEPAGSETERRIGPYRILREIGHGGMGTVYLAERADGQFEQQVALKLVRRGMDSEAVLQRFLRERQILARLQHPNIARLYDGGLSEDGRPYLVMEYIDGEPIDAYCEQHALPVEARLRLFETVGEAVQYAHRNLVVHRDLKPSNILVDRDGQARLLDFGIAKLLADDADDLTPTTLTEAGLRVMTPEYAAPEQVHGEAITTATDVYALGVVLYEILTGQRPYRFERRTPEEIARVVAEAEARRPSTVVDPTTGLRRRLEGDLDTIVLTALRKEPERRYATAEAFVADIRRHLDGLPVAAQRDRLGYRVGKFVRRHRVGVLASSVVVLALVLGLVGTLWQARQKGVEAAKAEEVRNFTVSLFEQANPDEAQGEELTVREVVEQGAERVETELAGQPDVQGEMFEVLADVYDNLGRYEEAQALHERSLAVRRGVYGEWHPDVAQSLHKLGGVLKAQGQYEEAEQYFRQALEMRRELLGDVDEYVGYSLSSLGLVLREQNRPDEAEPFIREALAIHRQVNGDVHENVSTDLNNLALVMYDRAEYDEAERLHREALAISREIYGADHTFLAIDLANLAIVLARKGDYGEAEKAHREALRIRRKLLGPDHSDLGSSLANFGVLLVNAGQLDSAIVYLREALRVGENAEDAHPHLAIHTYFLATTLYRMQRYEEADPLAEKALEMSQTAFGELHPRTAEVMGLIAQIRKRDGDLSEAEQLRRSILKIHQETFGEEHPRTVVQMGGLAQILEARRKYTEAETLLAQAEDLARRVMPEGDRARYFPAILQTYGKVLLAQNRYAEAETYLMESYTMLQEQTSRERQLRALRENLVDLYTTWGRPEDADRYRDP